MWQTKETKVFREKKGKDLLIYDYDIEQRYPVAITTVTEPDLKLDL